MADGGHELTQGHVGITGDDGGGVVPEIVHPDALKPEPNADVGPGMRQVLSPQGQAARAGEDGGVGSGTDVVPEVFDEGVEHESREGDRTPAGFGLRGSEDTAVAGQLMSLSRQRSRCRGAG